MGFRELFRRRAPVVRQENRVEFLGEQAGPNEDAVKHALVPELDAHPEIERAYLARIGFEPGADPSVALCIRSRSGDDLALVQRLSDIFVPLAPPNVFLDVLFLSAEQEEDLRRVCRPFYRSSLA